MPDGLALKDQAPSPTATAAQNAPLLAVMREALRHAAGRVVLRVPPMVPHRRRVALALLQEGALVAGGVVTEGAQHDLLLIGAEAGRAARLRALLDRLLGGPLTSAWSLERDAAALLDYAAGAEAGSARAAGRAPDLAGLDVWLRNLSLAQVARRATGMRLDASGIAARPAFLRLWIDRPALAGLLGGLGADGDVLEHAARSLASRLLIAIGDPLQRRELMGNSLPGPLHLPVPLAPFSGRGGDGGGAGRGGLVATMCLEVAADPAMLAARRAGLAAQGWELEIEGITATALRLMAIEALPVDWLRLSWSPALATAEVTEALRRVDPAKLILSGAEDRAALDWAARLGLRLVEGDAATALPAPLAAKLPNVLAGSMAQRPQPARPAA
ncbi:MULTISPECIES: hypothetical protein [Roseomonadaceae]|uniref:EAL domain-containing protein n=1 Tax=Falsiroseomonas oleicola TaxID=2801474 RepID=A0ABS6H0N5_9PROT|nr:hypothetical protein [Roseomonas oleicola]MBU8542214.1 hypothetical protein [Roseomonas oleicola]